MTEAQLNDQLMGAMRAAIALIRAGHHREAMAAMEGAERDGREFVAKATPAGQEGTLRGVSGHGR